jgi:hypothetical protein
MIPLKEGVQPGTGGQGTHRASVALLRGRFEIRCERAIWSRERGQSITFASSHFSRGAAVEIRHQMRAEIAGVIASTIDQSGFSTAHELSPHQIHPWQ